MALNPLIPLSSRAPVVDTGATISNALLNVEGIQRARQAPLRNRLLEAQVGTAEQQQTQAEQTTNIRSVAMGAAEVIPFLEKNDVDGALTTLFKRKTEIAARGGDTTQTDDAISLLQEGGAQELLEGSKELINRAQQFGIIEAPKVTTGTASQRDFQTFQKLKKEAEASGDQEAIDAANQFGRQSGFVRETAQELADIEVTEARQKAEAEAGVELATAPTIEASKTAARAAINRSEKAFDQIGNIKTNVNNIDEAISLIDQGAQTGVIQSRLPSVRAASVSLDNLQGRLGLDVLNNTTFGALSEGELRFALSTALPKNLAPPELRRWLERKKDAQLKLSGYLEEVATFLGTPGNTTKDFIELQKVNQLEQESPVADVDLSTLSDEELLRLRQSVQ